TATTGSIGLNQSEPSERTNALANLHRAAAGGCVADANFRELAGRSALPGWHWNFYRGGADRLLRWKVSSQLEAGFKARQVARSDRGQAFDLCRVDFAGRESSGAGLGSGDHRRSRVCCYRLAIDRGDGRCGYLSVQNGQIQNGRAGGNCRLVDSFDLTGKFAARLKFRQGISGN